MHSNNQPVFHYLIREDGSLGDAYFPSESPRPVQRTDAPGPVSSALPDPDDPDEDWDGDIPDTSGDFAMLGHLEEESAVQQPPPTADFAPDGAGSMVLLRWPRLARPAHLPAFVAGLPLTAIAATAFAPLHIPEDQFAGLYVSPVSFSIFCMRMGRLIQSESLDQGGPEEITLPDSITRIGAYAFWRCSRLRRIILPPGLASLPAGCFGECIRLEEITLPRQLQTIGWMPAPTDQAMPDTGVFAGCHALRQITLPASVSALGAHLFNSSGLVRLRVVDHGTAGWSRPVTVASTAFEHTAALLWLEKITPGGQVLYALGLPPARDKILASDPQFGQLLQIPQAFFSRGPEYFDQLAQSAFRLDFSARMALARLQNPPGLEPRDQRWYLELLVQYFDRAPQFMPGAGEEAAYAGLFDFLESQPGLTAADMSSLVRSAGRLGLSAELLSRMIEVRTRRFDTITGFEDMDLD